MTIIKIHCALYTLQCYVFAVSRLAVVADLRALQAELKTLCGLAARLEQHRVAVGVAVELLHGSLLEGGAAAGTAVAAGGAEGVEAGEAGLQQAQNEY